MDSEDDMHDAWGGTSDGDYYDKNEDEEESDRMPTDDDDESDYGFDENAADDLHPSSRLPQVFVSPQPCTCLNCLRAHGRRDSQVDCILFPVICGTSFFLQLSLRRTQGQVRIILSIESEEDPIHVHGVSQCHYPHYWCRRGF